MSSFINLLLLARWRNVLTRWDKKKLSAAVVGSDESWLTELDNEAFKQLISLNKTAIWVNVMAQFSRTWWGKRFIEALEEFTDSAS